MTTPAELAQAITDAALRPKRAKFGENEVEEQRLAEVVDAVQAATAIAAAGGNAFAMIRRAQVRPGTATGELPR